MGIDNVADKANYSKMLIIIIIIMIIIIIIMIIIIIIIMIIIIITTTTTIIIMIIIIIVRVKGLLQLCSLCWSRCFFFCCVETWFVYHDLASVFLQIQESLLFSF